MKIAHLLLATVALSSPSIAAPTACNALFVDVDAMPDLQSTLRVDAHVPLLVYDAPETFDQTFLGRMDEALRAKRLRFTDGVVLVSRSPRTALEAAELMREHGYGLVFAVTSQQYAGR